MKTSETRDTKVRDEEVQSGGKKTVYMFCVLLLLVILAIVSFFIDKKMKAGEIKEEPLESLKCAVVRIEAEIEATPGEETVLQGSGIIIAITEDYIDIATASHVVEETASPLVYFYDGSLAYGSVLAYGKENDIAFVRVEAENFSEGIGEIPKVAVCASGEEYEALQPKDEVILIGSVSRVAGNVEYGTILEKEQFVELFQNHMLICESTVLNGMSGGGTFTSDGRLIGILVGTNGREAVSVTVSDVLAEYENI